MIFMSQVMAEVHSLWEHYKNTGMFPSNTVVELLTWICEIKVLNPATDDRGEKMTFSIVKYASKLQFY
jgi:hypothetical protein